MEDAENFDHPVLAAIDDEMPGIPHRPQIDPGAVTAEAQVIGENALGEFRERLRTRAPGSASISRRA